MNEIYFEKMEAYLNDEMSDEERKQFESEMAADGELTSTFNLYKSVETNGRNNEQHREAEIALKNTLHLLNKTHFGNDNKTAAKIVSINRFKFYKMAAAVAACFIIVFAGYFLFLRPTPQQLASDYIKQNYSTLSYTMGSSNDSVQNGLAAYRKKEYKKSLEIFESVYNDHPSDNGVAKYIGIVYLVTNDYGNALKYFDLISKKNLANNPGNFLKAITLLQRNNDGDKEQAKTLLEQVVKEKAEGSEEAERWLTRF